MDKKLSNLSNNFLIQKSNEAKKPQVFNSFLLGNKVSFKGNPSEDCFESSKPTKNKTTNKFSNIAQSISKNLKAISFSGKDSKIIPDGVTDPKQIEEILKKIKINDKLILNDSAKKIAEQVTKDNVVYLNKLLNLPKKQLFIKYLPMLLQALNKENKPYLDKLLKARDEKLTGEDIAYILRNLNEKNEPCVDKLLKARDEKLTGKDIAYILRNINEKNEPCVDKLLKARDEKLTTKSIVRILQFINKENEPYVDKLLKARDEKLTSGSIVHILQATNEENSPCLDKLLKARDEELTCVAIAYILQAINEENAPSLDKLLKARDEKLTGEGIADILQVINKRNEPYLDKLLKARDEKLNGEDITCILQYINEKNAPSLDKLLKARDEKLTGENIAYILCHLNEENEPCVDKLLKARDEELNCVDIVNILCNLNEENKPYLDKLLKARDEKLTGEDIAFILYYVNEENEPYLDKLLKAHDEKLTGEDIAFILGNLNEENEPYLDKLFKARDEKLKSEDITCILQAINKENEPYLDKLLKIREEKLTGEDIAYILYHLNEENEPYLDKLLNASDGKLTGKDIAYILNCLNKEKMPLVGKLLKTRDKKLTGEEIARTLQSINEENELYLDKLLKACDGNLTGTEIIFILRVIDKKNAPYLDKLLKARDGNLTGNDIASILSIINKKNAPYLDKLFKARDGKLTSEEIKNILIGLNKNNKQHLYKAFTLKNAKQKPLSGYEIGAYLSFNKFKNIDNINQISKNEKKELLNSLITHNSSLFEVNLENHISILPKTSEEYCSLLNRLTNSIGIETTKLSESNINEFEKSMNDLAKQLKQEDLSKLDEIKLSISHNDLVEKTNSLTKDLSETEKAEVIDFFGFKIKANGELSGYPNDLKDADELSQVEDGKIKTVIKNLKPVVQKYCKNNKINLPKGFELLETELNNLAQNLPELYSIIGKTSQVDLQTLKSFKNIIEDKNFETLNDKDKKILKLAALMQNFNKTEGIAKESAFDAYHIAQKFNLNKTEQQKIYDVIKQRNFVANIVTAQDPKSEAKFRAFELKNDNVFKIATILCKANSKDILWSKIFKEVIDDVKANINKIRKDDFIIPQTKTQDILTVATKQTINGYNNINVANASDIKDFYAYVHAVDTGFTGTEVQKNMNLHNINSFNLIDSNKVICTSLVGNGKYQAAGQHGVMLNITPSKVYVGFGSDIWSPAKMDTQKLVNTYMYESKNKSNRNRPYFEDRTNVSKTLKNILNISDNDYIARLSKIKHCKNLDEIRKIDSEFANAYDELFEKDNILNSKRWSEYLVSNPKIQAIFTKDVEELPDEFLQYAQKNNLPVVVLN